MYPKCWGWEAPTALSKYGWEAMDSVAQRPRIGAQEEDGKMKNTGKRIFATAALLALVNLPLMVLAGVHVSQR